MKRKIFKTSLILFIIGIVTAFCVYLYVFHKPHRDIRAERAAYEISANQLIEDFSTNEEGSNAKYGNKVLLVSGIVADISTSNNGASIMLASEMNGISCSFDSVEVAQNKTLFHEISIGSTIRVKGQCDGQDMIMGVVLTRCVLKN